MVPPKCWGLIAVRNGHQAQLQGHERDVIVCNYINIQTIHFCSTGPELDELPPQVETEHHDGAAAVVRCEQLWKGRERLNVYFMNPEVLVSWDIGVTTQQTLDWANKAWSKSNVPQFIVCDSIRRADIRVKFAGN